MYQEWFFQFAFAATAATIVSGSVAERATFEAYLTYSFFLSIWVYPVVVHWVWGGGWLTFNQPTSLLGVGAFDFAGDGPVHMVGGVAGAIGSKIIGPRIGRFDSDGNPVDIPGHSSPLAFLGVFILWVGWFGFNSGSALTIVGNGLTAERAAVNTMLSSATGGLGSLFFSTLVKPGREWDINAALNGVLAGLVAITGCCPVVETWAALIIGLTGGIFYIGASAFTLKVLRIDDPLDATPVHAGLGMYGLIMGGFFASKQFMAEYRGEPESDDFAGVFYGGNGKLLACQVVEIVVIMAWVAAFIGPYFYFLKVMGWFRISTEAEEIGLDASSHGGAAYPELYEEARAGNMRKAHVNDEDSSVKSGNEAVEVPSVEVVTN
jgi:Amt family ammonium transporter